MTEEWGRERSGQLLDLVDASLPGENLTEDDVVATVWDDDDPGCVLATAGGDAAVAVVTREADERRVGYIKLLAVHPSAHRRGVGRSLLGEAETWLFDQGATAVVPGPSAPFYLWPGVDVRWTAAQCLFESAGYRVQGAIRNLSFPASHRSEPPPGVELRRVLEDADASAAVGFCTRHFPNWVPEMKRGIEHGACFLAWSTDEPPVVIGFGCHSVNRLGWLGPMGTDRSRRLAGVGNALLGAIAGDVRAAGLSSVEVAWIGPFGFYAKSAGASVSRTFMRLVKQRA